MTKLSTKILSNNEVEFMKERIEELLSKKGVIISHQEVLGLLKEAGAEVNGTNVRFPKHIIDEALKSVPKEFKLAGIDPKYDMEYPHPTGSFYTRTNTGGMTYLSADHDYRNITLEDVKEWVRLTNCMDNIDFVCLPSTTPKEVPGETVDIHTLRVVLENSKKHIWVQPYEGENVKYLIEMAQAFVGGEQELRERPIISLIACSTPSFEYKNMDMEIILQGCRNGVPIQPCSLPAAGANGPITLQGTALMACTEVMAMIITAQLIAPGTPVIATPLLFAMDMLTTCTIQSPIEVTMGRVAAVQIFQDGYGIPAHSYGTGTDSNDLDSQNFIERTSLTQMMALSGASILGGAGQLEVAKTISPIQLIIDNDIFGMARKLVKGFEINDETLGYQELMDISHGQSFITLDHTFKYFKDAYRPETFNRDSKTVWETKGAKDTIAKAKEIFDALTKEYEHVSVVAEKLNAMDEILNKADKVLVKKR